jgi:hypothetical protein
VRRGCKTVRMSVSERLEEKRRRTDERVPWIQGMVSVDWTGCRLDELDERGRIEWDEDLQA